MDGYAAHPARGGPFPLVVLFMDVWGLREELFAIARRIAGHGYYCLVPNLFYREGKIRYERRNAEGKMMSVVDVPAELREEMRVRSAKVDRLRAGADIAAMLAFCRGEPVDPGPAGSVGFCLGGRVAFYAGQEFPERFLANASLHGTHLATEAEDSPHLMTHRLRGEMYCGYGAQDRFATPEIRTAIDRAFAANPDVIYRQKLHAGAHHGYALPDRDIYDGEATEADWREIFAMFGRQLQPSGRANSGA